MLMFIGSCAGSTAGGIKVCRIGMLCKLGRREVRHTFQPRKVQAVRFEGKGVEETLLPQAATFFFVYVTAWCYWGRCWCRWRALTIWKPTSPRPLPA
ncbi:MAG: potassium transporter TrkG [Christensenellales bacterium]